MTDSVKVFGRLSRFHTTQRPDFTDGFRRSRWPAARQHGRLGDVVWTINLTTVFNFRGSWSKINDPAAPAVEIGEEGLSNLWPGNNWFSPHVADIPAVFHPQLDVRADTRTARRYGFVSGA